MIKIIEQQILNYQNKTNIQKMFLKITIINKMYLKMFIKTHRKLNQIFTECFNKNMIQINHNNSIFLLSLKKNNSMKKLKKSTIFIAS